MSAGCWRLRLGLVVAALAALLAFGLTLASRAEAYLYWANSGTNSIGAAYLDGTGVNTNFISTGGAVTDVAVDGAHIYWTSPHARTIGRANLDGSGQNNNFMTNLSGCSTCTISGIAVDRAHIYWYVTNGYIGRANLDGSGKNVGFIRTAPYTVNDAGVAVDSAHIYWINPPHSIGRANLDGSGVKQDFFTGMCNGFGVAVDANYVYSADTDHCGWGGQIIRVTLDGGVFAPNGYPLNPLGPSLMAPLDLAVDGAHIYWSRFRGTTIGRMNLDGSGANQSFISGLSDTNGVAVDAREPWVIGLTVARQQRLTRALARGVRLRLASTATGRACLELRLRARTARRLGLRPKRSERRLGKRVGHRRCLKLTANRPRKLAVRFSRRSRAALRELVRRYGPRRLAGLRRLVRRKGLSVRVRVVFTDTKGHRYTRSRPLRLVR